MFLIVMEEKEIPSINGSVRRYRTVSIQFFNDVSYSLPKVLNVGHVITPFLSHEPASNCYSYGIWYGIETC